jgi:hypothetical protein
LSKKFANKISKKKIENQLFLPKFLKNGQLEGKAYGESKKKLEIQKKS